MESAGQIERTALDAQFGARVAQARRRVLKEKVDSGQIDLATADIEGFLQGTIEGDLERYKGPAFASTYTAQMTQFADVLRTSASEARSTRVREELDQGYFDLLLGAAKEGLQGKAGEDQIVQNLLGVRTSHTAAMDRERLNAGLMNVAAELARDGHAGLVAKLLDTPMGGGAPSLSRIKDFAGKADEIRKAATDASQEKMREANWEWTTNLMMGISTGKVSSSQVAGLRDKFAAMGWTEQGFASLFNSAVAKEEEFARDAAKKALISQIQGVQDGLDQQNLVNLMAGRFELESSDTQLPSVSGGTKDYSVKEQREAVVKTYVAKVLNPMFDPAIAKAEAEGKPEEAKALRATKETQLFQTLKENGITEVSDLTRQLKAGYFAARTEGFTSEATRDAMDRYLRMRAVDPDWAKAVVGKDEAAAFFDRVDLYAREMTGGDHDAALKSAKLVEGKQDQLGWFRQMAAKGDLTKAVDTAIQSIEDQTGLFWDDEFQGSSMQAYDTIIKSAEGIVAHGMASETEALKLAAKQYAENHIQVQGVHIPVANVNLQFPRELPKLSKALSEAVITQLPDFQGREASELVVLPSETNGQLFDVYDRMTGLPITGDLKVKVGGMEFSLQNIRRRKLDTLNAILDAEAVIKATESADRVKQQHDESEARTGYRQFFGAPGSKSVIEIGPPNLGGLLNITPTE